MAIRLTRQSQLQGKVLSAGAEREHIQISPYSSCFLPPQCQYQRRKLSSNASPRKRVAHRRPRRELRRVAHRYYQRRLLPQTTFPPRQKLNFTKIGLRDGMHRAHGQQNGLRTRSDSVRPRRADVSSKHGALFPAPQSIPWTRRVICQVEKPDAAG